MTELSHERCYCCKRHFRPQGARKEVFGGCVCVGEGVKKQCWPKYFQFQGNLTRPLGKGGDYWLTLVGRKLRRLPDVEKELQVPSLSGHSRAQAGS